MGAVLDHFAIRDCVIAGNSFGGWVAWETALAQPGRVDALILVDSAGYTLNSQSVPLGFRIAKIPVLNRLVDNVLPRALIESSVQSVYGDPARVTPGYGARFERDIAGSSLVVFDDLGHVPQEEDPARTVASARPFIDAHRAMATGVSR
jgi:pimeloyl-ACP methyl ester carboxylesterase